MSALAVLLLLCGSSCLGGYLWGKATATRRDVTDQDILWGEFRRGGVYTLKYDFFLAQRDDWSRRLALGRTNELPGAGSAPSLAEYESDPAQWPYIKGVVKSGVRVRCVKLVSFGAPIFGRALFPFAEILDGPHQGKVVDIDTLNSWKDAEEGPNGMLLPKPDYQLVEEVAVDIDEGDS